MILLGGKDIAFFPPVSSYEVSSTYQPLPIRHKGATVSDISWRGGAPGLYQPSGTRSPIVRKQLYSNKIIITGNLFFFSNQPLSAISKALFLHLFRQLSELTHSE